jgi:Tol biopolymer transport system component
MMRATLFLIAVMLLTLTGVLSAARRDSVEPYYVLAQTSNSGGQFTCRMVYFDVPLDCVLTGDSFVSSYSPNGRWRVYPDFSNNEDGIIFLSPAAGGSPQEIFRSAAMRIESIHNWSPDSRWIVFTAYGRGSFRDIYSVEVATGQLTQLTASDSDEWFPAWSADGASIAFNTSSGTFDSVQLMTIRADGTQLQEPVPGFVEGFRPTWSRDGEWLIFHSNCTLEMLRLLGGQEIQCGGVIYHIFRVRLADGHIEQVVFFSGIQIFPALSPDGEWIAFLESAPNTSERQVYRMRRDGSDVQALTNDNNFYQPPVWIATPNLAWRPIILLMSAFVCLGFVWWKKP